MSWMCSQMKNRVSRGSCSSSAVDQLRETNAELMNASSKFICERIGYAGGDSVSQTVKTLPPPETMSEIQK